MLKRYSFLLFSLLLSIPLTAQNTGHQKIERINSSYNEFNPVLSPDGSRLYFTRAGHAANIGGVIDRGDIWYADVSDSGYSQPKHAGRLINHQGLNGVVGFSEDGNRMYLLNYLDESGNGQNLRNGVAMSSKVNGEWTKPERLNILYFENTSPHMSATISRDEKVLIMAIKSFLTEGNEDLYVSFAQADGQWSQPKNLGTSLNTYGEEWSPYLHKDGKTLYFASNGHGGEGSRDIFVSERIDGSWTNWTNPKNLGSEVNTPGVETGYFIPYGGGDAFLSSTQDSEGLGDIVNHVLPKDEPATIQLPRARTVQDDDEEEPIASMVSMMFQVLDKRTEEPVMAQVKLSYNGQETIVSTAELAADNYKFMKAFEEQTTVNVEIESDGYLKYVEQFQALSITQATGQSRSSGVETFYLTPDDVGTKITMDNILFNRGSARFSNPKEAQGQIDEVIKMMKENPGMVIKLGGHTDNRGDARLLKLLSEDRVKSVRKYMIGEGISPERIEIEGFGGEEPIADNSTPEGREKNRRVEFEIIK